MGDINLRVISTFMVRRDNKEWRKGRDQQGTEKGNQCRRTATRTVKCFGRRGK